MIQSKRVLGLIPARSGSKGLPGKNIILINGKPLIYWSILSGLNSAYIDNLVVSTDSEDIAKISVKYGADVPFMRPADLATDTTSTFDVITHAIGQLGKNNFKYDIVVLLEPTSPLRESSDIDRALEEMQEKKSSSIVSICLLEAFHPLFLYRLNTNKRLFPISGKYSNSIRRQDLDNVYFVDGTVYCSYVDKLIDMKGFYHEDTLGFVIPKWKSLEIDDEDDLIMVEALMKNRKM